MYSPFCRILIQRLVAEKSGGEILLSGKVSGTQEVQFGDGELGIVILSLLEPKKHRSNAPSKKKKHIILISNRRSHDLWKGGTKYQPVGVMNLESDLLAFLFFCGGGAYYGNK